MYKYIIGFLAAFLVLTAMNLVGPSEALAKKGNTLIKLQTSMGDIVIELYEDKAPATTANFKKYVEEGFYDGTIFHRVINNFMIQGGGMTEDLKAKKTGPQLKNEADNGLTNELYTVAMARTSDPHSATAQFFINVKNNPHLNHTGKDDSSWGYCVFGKVVEGMDVVDKIKEVPVGPRDMPKTAVIIKKASVL